MKILYNDMMPHQQRVVDEKKELDTKLTKLTEFMLTDTYKALGNKDKDLLVSQSIVMTTYGKILEQRIGLF
jgi:hypothetical protein